MFFDRRWSEVTSCQRAVCNDLYCFEGLLCCVREKVRSGVGCSSEKQAFMQQECLIDTKSRRSNVYRKSALQTDRPSTTVRLVMCRPRSCFVGGQLVSDKRLVWNE